MRVFKFEIEPPKGQNVRFYGELDGKVILPNGGFQIGKRTAPLPACVEREFNDRSVHGAGSKFRVRS